MRSWDLEMRAIAWSHLWILDQKATVTHFHELVLQLVGSNSVINLEAYELLERLCDAEMKMRDDGDCPLFGGVLEELRLSLNLSDDGLTDEEFRSVVKSFLVLTGEEKVIVRAETRGTWEQLVAEVRARRAHRRKVAP